MLYSKKKHNKALFLIIGESFRLGNQCTRVRGIPEAYADQKLACFSHMDFVNYLEKKHNINIDVVLNSYTTRYDNEIINWYEKKLIKYKFYPYAIDFDNIYRTGIDLIENKNYDFIFVHRVDLFFKKYMKKVFNIKWKKITFPSILTCIPCWSNHYPSWRLNWNNESRINDMMMFIPNKFLNNFLNKQFWLNHDCFNNIGKNNINFFLNTYHCSDSYKDWNPLYRIVNRYECKIWRSKGYIYDSDYNPIKSNQNPKFIHSLYL